MDIHFRFGLFNVSFYYYERKIRKYQSEVRPEVLLNRKAHLAPPDGVGTLKYGGNILILPDAKG